MRKYMPLLRSWAGDVEADHPINMALLTELFLNQVAVSFSSDGRWQTWRNQATKVSTKWRTKCGDEVQDEGQGTNSSSCRCGSRPRSKAKPRKRRMASLPFS